MLLVFGQRREQLGVDGDELPAIRDVPVGTAIANTVELLEDPIGINVRCRSVCGLSDETAELVRDECEPVRKSAVHANASHAQVLEHVLESVGHTVNDGDIRHAGQSLQRVHGPEEPVDERRIGAADVDRARKLLGIGQERFDELLGLRVKMLQ